MSNVLRGDRPDSRESFGGHDFLIKCMEAGTASRYIFASVIDALGKPAPVEPREDERKIATIETLEGGSCIVVQATAGQASNKRYIVEVSSAEGDCITADTHNLLWLSRKYSAAKKNDGIEDDRNFIDESERLSYKISPQDILDSAYYEATKLAEIALMLPVDQGLRDEVLKQLEQIDKLA